jgi:hypothetical protein
LDLELMVVEGLHDLLDGTNDEFVFVVTVGVDKEVQLQPFLFDLLDLALNTTLAGSSSRDLFDLLPFLFSTIA